MEPTRFSKDPVQYKVGFLPSYCSPQSKGFSTRLETVFWARGWARSLGTRTDSKLRHEDGFEV